MREIYSPTDILMTDLSTALILLILLFSLAAESFGQEKFPIARSRLVPPPGGSPTCGIWSRKGER
jgi:hypothetical protein